MAELPTWSDFNIRGTHGRRSRDFRFHSWSRTLPAQAFWEPFTCYKIGQPIMIIAVNKAPSDVTIFQMRVCALEFVT